MGNLGMGEILIIAVVALVLFGPKRIPEVAKALGKTVNAFKAGLREHYTEEKPAGEQPKGAAPEEVKKLEDKYGVEPISTNIEIDKLLSLSTSDITGKVNWYQFIKNFQS